MDRIVEWFKKLPQKDFDYASIKLAGYYTLIAMTISVAFSVTLYSIASQEINRGFGRQSGVVRELGLRSDFPTLEQIKVDLIQESNNRLRNNLLYYNLAILLLASTASYFLAKKTLEPIEEMVNTQNRFTADASHELRTPLTAMRSEIEVNLRDKKLGLSEAKALLQSNLEEINKLESLSNALLKLARYQEDNQVIFEIVSLEEIVAEAYERIESLAGRKQILFENSLTDLKVAGDRQSLVELFVILLDNAIKYSPAKSTIKIEMRSEKNSAIVEIKDQGVGIKASEIPFIFNRFYRADLSRSKEQVDGYGLGLSIAKQIVDLHQGKILVASKPNHGTSFLVSFKLFK